MTSPSTGETRHVCAWCHASITAAVRRDAKFCSKRCRQASHRFGKGRVVRDVADAPMRFAYADPPYPGNSRRYYGKHADFAGEVDHNDLVQELIAADYDGWALSTSSAALRDVLLVCPADVRVAVWVCGERPTRSYRPLTAWEPVIYWGGRPVLTEPAERRVDVLNLRSRARTTDPARVIGSKPADFCWWLFELLGARPGDDLVDVFPGSGGVGRAWSRVAAAGHDDTSRGSARHVVEDLNDIRRADQVQTA